jgi:hypothetical protein
MGLEELTGSPRQECAAGEVQRARTSVDLTVTSWYGGTSVRASAVSHHVMTTFPFPDRTPADIETLVAVGSA